VRCKLEHVQSLEIRKVHESTYEVETDSRALWIWSRAPQLFCTYSLQGILLIEDMHKSMKLVVMK